VSDEWWKRHVEEKKLITAPYMRDLLKNHILPAWGGRDFESIRRSDVAKLLDQVKDKSGATSADKVLSVVRSIMNWYATRNDAYASPIVKGMRRTNQKEQARSRVLSDDEIRALGPRYAIWNHPTLKRRVENDGFPSGTWFGPNTRIWYEDECDK